MNDRQGRKDEGQGGGMGGCCFKITHAKCLCHAAELHSAQESKHTHMLTLVLSLHILCAHPLERYVCVCMCLCLCSMYVSFNTNGLPTSLHTPAVVQ